MNRFLRPSRLLAVACVLLLTGLTAVAQSVREKVAAAILLTDSEAQVAAVRALAADGAEGMEACRAWREGELFIHETDEGVRTVVQPSGDKAADDTQTLTKYADGQPLLDAAGAPVRAIVADLETAETDSALRLAMKDIADLIRLSDPDQTKRLRAVQDIGLAQEPEKLGALQTAAAAETDSKVKRAFKEAIALIQLRAEDPAVQIDAARQLGELNSIPSQDALRTLQREATEAGKANVAAAAAAALHEIAGHVKVVNTIGTAFRGLSSGSVLLIISIGLAITFGLMGVINMAHGELIAVGAYTTYIVQNVFSTGLALSPFGMSLTIPGLGLTGAGADAYFLVALPFSFLAAALVGVIMERCVIRFLYRRPLESLLATWGVSLLLQQLFRLTFGPNNVQVTSPAWLSGNWTVNDVLFGWNRLFVIGFAILLVIGTALLLRKTSLGLLIRAVMQNRNMAACMGVRTDRVNMLTFALGSGLAGLAGAFLSQIGNVGPGLGQSHIVDSFMTVVSGGVGNLAGTIVSALGIGMLDQSLQQILGNPVTGKILVLGGIILFLQFRPAGLFVTRSRSLES